MAHKKRLFILFLFLSALAPGGLHVHASSLAKADITTPDFSQKNNAPAICQSAQCLSLTTYNAYWLGSARRPSRTLRDNREISNIFKMLVATNSDVILFQEINTKRNSRKQNENFSTASYALLKSLLEQQGYQVSHGESGFTQQLAIATKTTVSIIKPAFELDVDNSFYLDSNCKTRNLRKPLAIHLSMDEASFLVVNLHLKSSYKNPTCAQRIRELQSTQLLAAVKSISGDLKENKIIIGGDFNTDESEPGIRRLVEEGFTAIIPAQANTAPDQKNMTPLSTIFSFQRLFSRTGQKPSRSIPRQILRLMTLSLTKFIQTIDRLPPGLY